MPLISSPVTYPPCSSPPQAVESRKRSLHSDAPYKAKRQFLGSNGIDTGNPKVVKLKPTPQLSTDPGSPPKPFLKSKGPFVDDEDEDDGQLFEDPRRVPFQVGEETPPWGDQRIINGGRSDNEAIIRASTSTGKAFYVGIKGKTAAISYEKLIAERSATAPGRATKSFYGIDIHALIDQVVSDKRHPRKARSENLEDQVRLPVEGPRLTKEARKRSDMLWTERYRARKFTDLVGDERTHRDVLRWIKNWDPVVFPGTAKPKAKRMFNGEDQEQKPHRKILMLTGPPGLGKTTLAHVCARQAGYEIVEINASDDRTSQVVRGKIRDCVGTENVKGVNTNTEQGKVRKAGRPVCVIVDEVDGVVGGSGGSGEGGFIKALVDLVALDQKNSSLSAPMSGSLTKSKRKGEKFRLLRPIILICNDVYHPSLRPLRTSSMAEIIHVRKPPLEQIVARLKSVFDKEGLPCDSEGVRKLCEATWGVTSRKDGQSRANGEGDMRGILVVGEWAASKLRASSKGPTRLTKKWVEDNMIEGLSHGGGGSRGVGRGGVKEAVKRVFLDGAGFAKPAFSGPVGDLTDMKIEGVVGVTEFAKRNATDRLREIIDASGDSDRIITECFATYPSHPFQDDTFLSKPNAACDWLHFHDLVSSKVHVGQEWELGSYLSHSTLGLHFLFASPARQVWSDQKRWDEDAEEEPTPFSGPRADYEASEALKQNKAVLQGFQSSLSISLMRSFRSAEDLSTDFLPHLLKLLTPNVKPIVVGGSGDQAGIVSVRKEGERQMVERAVSVMDAVGVTFERVRVDSNRSGVSSYVYRMEP